MHLYTPGIKLKLYQIKATNVIIYGTINEYQCYEKASITIFTIKPIGTIIQHILLSIVLVICFHYSLKVLMNIVDKNAAKTPIIQRA